jgi:capsule polysaccharide export protein KpsE/RkpR
MIIVAAPPRTWAQRASLLWDHRRFLGKVAVVAFVCSLTLTLLIPKEYKSSTSIMPPSSGGASTAMFAALAGKALGGMGGLGSLAGSLLGNSTSTALYIEMLHSGTISGHIADRFQLQKVYRRRYRVDTLKALARHVDVRDDKKSGVITITVQDRDPVRARDMAQAYLDELNQLLNRTSTSSAHQERVFVEHRLKQARIDLDKAQERLGEFSSTHSTIDLKEQARAEVTAAATLQAQILIEESNISSLRQIYGDGNIRLRAAEARASTLRAQLAKIGGTSTPLPKEGDGQSNDDAGQLYPSLRQLPRLAVPFADRYREVAVQEKLFELLTEQFEMARISEARDIPVVSVIDYPGIAEKHTFPPRRLLIVGLWIVIMFAVCFSLILRTHWHAVPSDDERRVLIEKVQHSLAAVFGRSRWGAR